MDQPHHILMPVRQYPQTFPLLRNWHFNQSWWLKLAQTTWVRRPIIDRTQQGSPRAPCAAECVCIHSNHIGLHEKFNITQSSVKLNYANNIASGTATAILSSISWTLDVNFWHCFLFDLTSSESSKMCKMLETALFRGRNASAGSLRAVKTMSGTAKAVAHCCMVLSGGLRRLRSTKRPFIANDSGGGSSSTWRIHLLHNRVVYPGCHAVCVSVYTIPTNAVKSDVQASRGKAGDLSKSGVWDGREV